MLQNWVEFRPCTVGQVKIFLIALQTIVVGFVSMREGVFVFLLKTKCHHMSMLIAIFLLSLSGIDETTEGK